MVRCALSPGFVFRSAKTRFFFCTLPCVAACAAVAQSSMPLRGTVIDAQTHRGIARVLVELNGNQDGQLTDADGHFSFPDVAPGGVSLRFRRPGYFDPLTGSENGQRTLTLAAAGTDASPGTGAPAEQTLTLEQDAAVRGRVIVPDGDSALGVRVDLYAARVSDGWRHWYVLRSAAVRPDGGFLFGSLQPGDYAVHAQGSIDPVPEGTPTGVRSGYGPVFAPAATDLASATIVTLRAGQTGEADPELGRVPYYPVAIQVAGDPSGVRATITGNGFTRWSPHSSRETHGFATELPSGSYSLHAFSFGRFGGGGGGASSGTLSFDVHDAPATNLSMTLNPTAPITLDTQVDEAASDASSTQTSSTATPPKIVLVQFTPVDAPLEGLIEGFVRQDKSGGPQTLEASVDAGSYWVSATVTGGYAESLSSGGTDLLREPLVVDPASPPTLSAELSPQTATIQATLGTQLAAQSCVLQLIPLSPGGHSQSRMVDDGTTTVAFGGLTPGNYLLFATPGLVSIAYREAGVLQQLTGERVSVAAGATAQVTVTSLVAPPEGTAEPGREMH